MNLQTSPQMNFKQMIQFNQSSFIIRWSKEAITYIQRYCSQIDDHKPFRAIKDPTPGFMTTQVPGISQ